MHAQGGPPTGMAAAREGVAALRSYAWLVAGLTVVGLLVGYLLGGPSGEVRYRAWISPQPLGANASVVALGISTPDAPQAADFLSDGVVLRVEADTGLDFGYLIGHLTLDQPPNGEPNPPIELVASAGSEADARALLASWMRAIREARMHYVARVLAKGEAGLRKSLRKAVRQGEPATAKEIAVLLARMKTVRATLSGDYLLQRAPRPMNEPAVSRPRSAVLGAVAGLIFGVAFALLLALVAGRIRTAEGVEAALDMEVLADLRSDGGIPSTEHARERLRALCGGRLPSVLFVVPCGDMDAEPDGKLSRRLGDDIELKLAGTVGDAGLLADLDRAECWAIVARPGAISRAEATALRTELGGLGASAAGLLVV